MNDYYRIRDHCREGLIRYLNKACSIIPKTEYSLTLDIGCGTGVPTLWFADNFPGTITAIDTDKDALEFLRKKISDRNLEDKVRTLCISIFDFKPGPDHFDKILAEGSLNVTGFEKGFKRAIGILHNGGYFIIHDEYKDHNQKCAFIEANNCKIADTLYLDETIWWDDYYQQLENEINKIKDPGIRNAFKNDIKEIENYKINPSPFRSMFYIVQKL